MIEQTIERWHRFLRGDLPGGLDVLLHDDVVFYSPIVYTPQRGKAVTALYLEAARQTLTGGDTGAERSPAAEPDTGAPGFHYTKQVLSGSLAVLEFETTVDGRYVNGVDIIRCDDDGRIVELRVMLRPLQAVQIVHAHMAAALDSLA